MFVLAIKNILRRRGIAVLALLGVGLGSALVVTLLSLSGGLNRQVNETVTALAGKLVVSPKDALLGGLYFSTGTPLPPEDMAVVRRIPGGRAVYGLVTTSLRPADDPMLLLPFTGYSPQETASSQSTPFPRLVTGRAPVNDREVVVGKTLFDALAFIGHGFTVGETYTFVGPARTVNLTVTGVFQTGDELEDSNVCGFAGLGWYLAGMPRADYSSLSVTVVRPDRVEPVEAAIRRVLADKKPPVQVVAPENLLNPLEASVQAIDRFLLAITAITALGCILFIFIMMYDVHRRAGADGGVRCFESGRLARPAHNRAGADRVADTERGRLAAGTDLGLRRLSGGRPLPEAWCTGVRRTVAFRLSSPGRPGGYGGRALSGRQGEQVRPSGNFSPWLNPGRRIAHDPCGKRDQGVRNRLLGGQGAGRLQSGCGQRRLLRLGGAFRFR